MNALSINSNSATDSFFPFFSLSSVLLVTCRANDCVYYFRRSYLLYGNIYPLLFWKYENCLPECNNKTSGLVLVHFLLQYSFLFEYIARAKSFFRLDGCLCLFINFMSLKQWGYFLLFELIPELNFVNVLRNIKLFEVCPNVFF